jgi:hypothetical protein
VEVIDEAAHLLAKEELIDWVIYGEELSLGNRTRNEKRKTSESYEEEISSFSETVEG